MVEPLSRPSAASDERDWPLQLTDTIVNAVDAVRSKTTRPAILVARAVVFGLVAALLGFIAFILLLVGLFRLVDGKLPGDVWATYLLFGGVFTLGGVVLFRQRKPRSATR
jgi:hypothetical protein